MADSGAEGLESAVDVQIQLAATRVHTISITSVDTAPGSAPASYQLASYEAAAEHAMYRWPQDEFYEDEYAEGTHYSLSTVTEEGSQSVDATGTESQRGLSPIESILNFNVSIDRAEPSRPPSRLPASEPHSPPPLGDSDASMHTSTSQPASQLLTPLTEPEFAVTIEAHDRLFAEEIFEWTSQRTEMPEDSKQDEWAGTGTWISDENEWRIRLDMREAEVMAASEHQRIIGDDDTHMETQSTEVATPAADLFVILSKSGAPSVLGRVPSYKLKQPAPFDIRKALLEEEGSAGENEDVPKTQQHGDDLTHHEERGRQVEAGKKLDGQTHWQECIEKFQDDGLSGTAHGGDKMQMVLQQEEGETQRREVMKRQEAQEGRDDPAHRVLTHDVAEAPHIAIHLTQMESVSGMQEGDRAGERERAREGKGEGEEEGEGEGEGRLLEEERGREQEQEGERGSEGVRVEEAEAEGKRQEEEELAQEEEMQREVLAVRKRVPREEHFKTLTAANNLAGKGVVEGDPMQIVLQQEEGETQRQEAMQMQEAQEGRDDPAHRVLTHDVAEAPYTAIALRELESVEGRQEDDREVPLGLVYRASPHSMERLQEETVPFSVDSARISIPRQLQDVPGMDDTFVLPSSVTPTHGHEQPIKFVDVHLAETDASKEPVNAAQSQVECHVDAVQAAVGDKIMEIKLAVAARVYEEVDCKGGALADVMVNVSPAIIVISNEEQDVGACDEQIITDAQAHANKSTLEADTHTVHCGIDESDSESRVCSVAAKEEEEEQDKQDEDEDEDEGHSTDLFVKATSSWGSDVTIKKKSFQEIQRQQLAERLEEMLEPYIAALESKCAAISSDVERSCTVAQDQGVKITEAISHSEAHVHSVSEALRVLSSNLRTLDQRTAEKQAQLLKIQEENDILQAMSTARQVVTGAVTGDSASGVPSPVIDGGEQTPKDVSKIADASASELQRMKNKLQNVNSILSQQERKIAGLERTLASSQNLARQREEEINKLQDRLYECESDSRRKIEKLTTYTQNLVKAIEKKELERDEKKAEIYRLHARIEEKEKEIAKNHEDMKQIRVDNRKELLVLENERRKSVEAHKTTQAELSLTQTETSKRILSLESECATLLEEIEELKKASELQDIKMKALEARDLELSGGHTEARSKLSYFVNKAIDADKEAIEYKNQVRAAEDALRQMREHSKSLKKSKTNLESRLQETLNSEAKLQRGLDKALRDIDEFQVVVATLEKEKKDTNMDLALAHRKIASLEDLNTRNKRKYDQDTDYCDTRITTLESKVHVAEMREGHLLKQVQEVSQARDILSRDLTRCMNDLRGSRECVEALRNEKDALERILMSKKVLERGYQHRALSLEKALSGKSGGGGGIPYRIGSEQGGAGASHFDVSIQGPGWSDGAKEGDSAKDCKGDSFFQAESSVLSSIRDNTVLSGGASPCTEEGTRSVWSRNKEEASSWTLGDGTMLPGFSGQKARGEIQTVHGLKSLTDDWAQDARNQDHVAVPMVPRPPPNHVKFASEGSHTRRAGGKPKVGEGQAHRQQESARAAGDKGPRAHRLHTISLPGARASLSAAPSAANEERGGASGATDRIAQMLTEDVEYLQRLVRGGSGVL